MLTLLHSVPPTLYQTTTDSCLCQTLLDNHGQLWVSLLWGHCSFLLSPGAHKNLFVPSKRLYPQSCVSSGGSMVGLIVTSFKRTYAIPSLLYPEPLSLYQSAADPYLCRRHLNTGLAQTLWGLWVLISTRFFFLALWASLVVMGFNYKCNFTPPNVLLGFLLLPSQNGCHQKVYKRSFQFKMAEYKDVHSSFPFPCESTKTVTNCCTTINRKMLKPTKKINKINKAIPHSKTKKNPQDGRRGSIMINPNPIPARWVTAGWRTIISKKFSQSCKGSEPHVRHASLGIQKRDWKSQIWPWGPAGFNYRISRGLRETETPVLAGTNKTLHAPRPRWEEQWSHKTVTQTCSWLSRILWPLDVKNWLTGKDLDAGKDWKQEKGTTEDEMVGWHHELDGHEFEQALGVGDEQGTLAWFSSWGHKDSDMTEWLNWTDV